MRRVERPISPFWAPFDTLMTTQVVFAGIAPAKATCGSAEQRAARPATVRTERMRSMVRKRRSDLRNGILKWVYAF